jgi:hypothetical protein
MHLLSFSVVALLVILQTHQQQQSAEKLMCSFAVCLVVALSNW